MDAAQPRKRVHRVLHFSDGIVEEFSDEEADDLDSAPAKLQEPPVDPVSYIHDNSKITLPGASVSCPPTMYCRFFMVP